MASKVKRARKDRPAHQASAVSRVLAAIRATTVWAARKEMRARPASVGYLVRKVR